jgi:uncharacterized membrane protein YbaN (DUF454 family)
MEKIKKAFFLTLGFICLFMAYIGLVTPGIPYSPFLVGSAYCFAKSSKRMERWLYNHKIFGPFLLNWQTKKVFPTKMKFMMIGMMLLSLTIIMFTSGNLFILVPLASVMVIVAVWAWRFPGSPDEYENRKILGKKVGGYFD